MLRPRKAFSSKKQTKAVLAGKGRPVWVHSRELNKILSDTFESEREVRVRRVPQFRASALPFCPLLHYHDTIIDKKEDTSTENFGMEFYTRIGSVIHSLMQDFSKHSATVSLLGDWQCTRVLEQTTTDTSATVRRCTALSKMTTFDKLKVKCPHGKVDCKSYYEYSEIEIKWRGLSGHIDTLLLIKRPGKRSLLYLLDYKTTSDFLFTDKDLAISRGYYPSKKYLEQIESYVVVLKELFNLDVDFYGIVYLSRQHPTSKLRRRTQHYTFLRQVTPKLRERRMRTLLRQVKGHKAALKALAAKRGDLKPALQEVYETRPCKTPEQYEERMKARFFGSENCPFHENKRCYSGAIIKDLLKLTDGEITDKAILQVNEE